ncbi:MAG: extracellular solute-binding protein [Chloroflexi bacterium]|nr:extracellular solute-binding protein [Chloroflexota bacterium]
MTRRKMLLGLGSGASLALLAACGTATTMTDEAPAAAEETEAKAEEQPAAPETYEIRVFTTATWDLSQGIGLEVVQELEEANPGITVNATAESGNRMDKMVTAVAAGFGLDVGQAGSWQSQTLAVLKVPHGLDSYMAASDVIKKEEIWESLRGDLEWKGVVHGMPFGPDIRFLYVGNKAYLDAGLDPENPPASWTDLEDAISTLYTVSGDKIEKLGFDPLRGTGGNHLWMVPMWQLGGDTTSPEGLVTLDTPEAEEALNWQKRNIYDAQGGYNQVLDFWGEAARYPAYFQPFFQGVVGNMHLTNSERATQIWPNSPDFEFSFGPYPVPEGGRQAGYGGCHTWFLTVDSPDPEKGWKFLEHFGSAGVNVRWAQHFDRLPIRADVANDEEYHQGDEFVLFAANMMQHRKFVIPLPGAPQVLSFVNGFVPDVMAGNRTIPEALKEAEEQVQTILDDFLAEHGETR